ncbi:hypothetical protein WA026_023679 [Henosepilachna vigintioctopunctata]|uniref:Uncharacterized protein n=1 Tax=Henosepilachna vigintioctopunctata TaxID=420089 RepID=A0AAW1UDN7_9CUCU
MLDLARQTLKDAHLIGGIPCSQTIVEPSLIDLELPPSASTLGPGLIPDFSTTREAPLIENGINEYSSSNQVIGINSEINPVTENVTPVHRRPIINEKQLEHSHEDGRPNRDFAGSSRRVSFGFSPKENSGNPVIETLSSTKIEPTLENVKISPKKSISHYDVPNVSCIPVWK